MTRSHILTRSDLANLTGYTQPARQLRWLRNTLRLSPPTRADGLPVVSLAQVEAALAGATQATARAPNWRKPPP
jgi:Domain of unknown function (DUF4224)